MSKSSGNVRDPVSYEKAFGPDVLRYFVMREVVYGLDGDFSEERLTDRYNADLANDLGNVVSRVLSMAQRYFDGEIPVAAKLAENADAVDLIQSSEHKLFLCFGRDGQALEQKVAAAVDDLDFKGALEDIWQTLDAANNISLLPRRSVSPKTREPAAGRADSRQPDRSHSRRRRRARTVHAGHRGKDLRDA